MNTKHLDINKIAQTGKAFDFLKDEEELYSEADVQ